jgi:hypothetical protein
MSRSWWGLAAAVGCESVTDVVPDVAPRMEASVETGTAVTSLTPSLDFWPYTGTGPDMATEKDPINLIFLGNAHPLDIRAALMSLDGQRSLPFNCT